MIYGLPHATLACSSRAMRTARPDSGRYVQDHRDLDADDVR
jgi:hypothetical protein